MKNLKITVNGKTYDVAVEEVGTSSASVSAPAPAAAPAAAPAPVAAAVPEKESAPAAASVPAAPVVAGGKPVLCPMPGSIVNVMVKPGDAVKKGNVLLILEAMKMENEIQAAADGTVASVEVQKGDNVNADDVLLTIA